MRLWSSFPLAQTFARPLCFALVGLSGVVVNTVVLAALVRAGLPLVVAGTLASEAAVVSNFVLNDRWTFRRANAGHHVIVRLLRFNGVALGGIVLSVTVLSALTAYGPLSLLPANLIAIASATGWNYLVNSRWTWRSAPPPESPLA
jgi:putative flippase GtrA